MPGEIIAKFRVLLAQKAETERRNITLKEVRKKTGIAWTTLQSWANNKVKRFDAPVIIKLCDYLELRAGRIDYIRARVTEQESSLNRKYLGVCMKKIIIQCGGSKNGEPWTVSGLGGKKVKFVSHPDSESCEVTPEIHLFRPDDMVPDHITTWRQYLSDYNKRKDNPDCLLKAGDLYQDNTYRILIDKFGWENTYILSAGWGLIKSDFLLPYYDITFSHLGDKCARRHKNDIFEDYNQLLSEPLNNDEVYIFVGLEYLPLLYKLTQNIPIKKYIFHKAEFITRKPDFEYIYYNTNRVTNWHYSCAQDFVDGKISP